MPTVAAVTGGISFSGAAVGSSTASAHASGEIVFGGALRGAAKRVAAVSGGISFGGSLVGAGYSIGAVTGGVAFTGAAAGRRTAAAAVSGGVSFAGNLTGGLFSTTLLVLDPTGIPPFSGRGITQKLEVIAQAGKFERDVNGTLVNLSPTQFRKYRLTLSCTDVEAPAFSALWPGMTVVIDCSDELGGALAGTPPERPIVPGTYRTEGSFYYYRPRLTCMVTGSWTQTFHEWSAERAWDLPLEEI